MSDVKEEADAPATFQKMKALPEVKGPSKSHAHFDDHESIVESESKGSAQKTSGSSLSKNGWKRTQPNTQNLKGALITRDADGSKASAAAADGIGENRKKKVGFELAEYDPDKKKPLYHPAPASQNKPGVLESLTTKTAIDFIKKQVDLLDETPKDGPRSDPNSVPLLSIKVPRRMSIAALAPTASNGLEIIMKSSRSTDDETRMSKQLLAVHKEVYSVPDVAWKVFWKASSKKDKPVNLGREKASKMFKIPGLVAGTWRFEGWTTDTNRKLPLRQIFISLTLIGNDGMAIFTGVNLMIAEANEMYRHQFDVLEISQPATLEVSATCPVVIKMPFRATVSQCVPADEGDAPDIHLFNPDTLPPAQKAKYLYACKGWSDIDIIGISPLSYDHSKALYEMTRPSKYRDRAEKEGMIRPFLFLISMHPHRRVFWSKTIGIDLMKKRFFPHPHKEAWHLITRRKIGMRDRVNDAYGEKLNPFARTTNWYEVIYRVSYTVFVKRVLTEGLMKNTEVTKEIRAVIKECKKSYRTGMNGCSDPEQAPMIRKLEEAFLIAFMHKMKERLAPEKQKAMENLVESAPESLELRNRMIEAGWKNSDLISFAVGIMLYRQPKGIIMEMIGYATSKHDSDAFEYTTIVFPLIFLFISPLPYIPMVMLARSAIGYLLKPDPGALLPIIFGICIQRVWLSFAGIRVEDLYKLKGGESDNINKFIPPTPKHLINSHEAKDPQPEPEKGSSAQTLPLHQALKMPQSPQQTTQTREPRELKRGDSAFVPHRATPSQPQNLSSTQIGNRIQARMYPRSREDLENLIQRKGVEEIENTPQKEIQEEEEPHEEKAESNEEHGEDLDDSESVSEEGEEHLGQEAVPNIHKQEEEKLQQDTSKQELKQMAPIEEAKKQYKFQVTQSSKIYTTTRANVVVTPTKDTHLKPQFFDR